MLRKITVLVAFVVTLVFGPGSFSPFGTQGETVGSVQASIIGDDDRVPVNANPTSEFDAMLWRTARVQFFIEEGQDRFSGHDSFAGHGFLLEYQERHFFVMSCHGLFHEDGSKLYKQTRLDLYFGFHLLSHDMDRSFVPLSISFAGWDDHFVRSCSGWLKPKEHRTPDVLAFPIDIEAVQETT